MRLPLNNSCNTWKSHRMLEKLCMAMMLFWLSSCALYNNETYNPYRSHHTKEGFRNTHVEERLKKRGVMRWLTDVFKANVEAGTLKYVPETEPVDLEKIHHPDPDKIQLTWVGHATFLIQIEGMNILTDPIFSYRASPLPFWGPRRRAAPGIALKDLPPIDIVVISHNHYDHLDVNTIRALGPDALYLTPLGFEQWFADRGVPQSRQLDWWQTIKLTGFNFTLVPAQHFSGRMILDLNKTLWGGWVIEKNGRKVYFAGDTGYTKEFKELGARMGPMDVSLLPIGAYAPRDVLKLLHADPYDAVQMHQDVKSKRSIGMHWGTFRLTTEPLQEPPAILRDALKKAGLSEKEFFTVKIGQTVAY